MNNRLSKFLCLLGFHNWSSWGEPVTQHWSKKLTDRSPLTLATNNMEPKVTITPFTREVQSRRCMDCREVKDRIVRESLDTSFL